MCLSLTVLRHCTKVLLLVANHDMAVSQCFIITAKHGMAVFSVLPHHQVFLFFAYWIALVLLSRPGTEPGKMREALYITVHHSSCLSQATIKVLKYS